MSSEQLEPGLVSGDEVGRAHSQGFDRALELALSRLKGDEGELLVVPSVVVKPNPGGVGQYKIELKPKG